MASSPRVLPVTVLCGFLGAGKTTLLNNILRDNHGMKIALIVNDMGSVNIDAALVKQSNAEYMACTERVVEMQNGCICCTLREDLLQEVAALARRGVFDYLVIESSGISEPMPIAETFTFEDEPDSHDHRHHQHHHQPSSKTKTVLSLMDSARLDTMVTVIDCFNFLRNLRSVESVRDRDKDADAADERGIAHLLIDQVEFADVIILNKAEMLSPEELRSVRATVVALNPSAKLHVTSYSKIDLSCVINTGLFSMEKAGQHAGWLKELRGEHVPETLEYGISSFVYRARRPFHVGRLHSLLETCFLFNSARPSDDAEAAAVLQLRLQAQARLDSSQPLAAPLRSKGFIWLSSMHLKVCEWAQAGAMISITPHGPWFVDVPLSSWPEEDAARAAIKADMQGAHGDRRQELVFIGQVAQPHVLARCISALGNLLQGVDEAAVRASLDACLLTEEEFALQPAEWKGLCDDPFETSQGPWDEGDEAWGLGLYVDACSSYLRAARTVNAAKGWEQRHAATVAAVEMILDTRQESLLPAAVQLAVAKAAADWLRGLADA